MHVLVTGHTGFKGAWLTLLLRERGWEVSGLSLDPEPGALFERAQLAGDLRHDVRGDIRDPEAVASALTRTRPDAVIHMAAQPLVRESYRDPRGTILTNVVGTLNVLDAVRRCSSVQAHVVVTTDKVYRNVGQEAGYAESDPLGGHDPYSASKAMADLLAQSWRMSFDGPPTAVARAGNVIGGGDVCRDRLLPDLMVAFTNGTPARLRFPRAVRPWQHVLDCLAGYLRLLDGLLEGPLGQWEWNFGPGSDSFRTVAELADLAASQWGDGASWTTDSTAHPHEATLLALDATAARERLGWQERLSFHDAVLWTVQWHQAVQRGVHPRAKCLAQTQAFTQGTFPAP